VTCEASSLLGMWPEAVEVPRAGASPSQVSPDEPSCSNIARGTPSLFLQEKSYARRNLGSVKAKPELNKAGNSRHDGRLHRGPPSRQRLQDDEGPRRRTCVAVLKMGTSSGHMSPLHSWGMETFVNHK
jgi:hypothetical protein